MTSDRGGQSRALAAGRVRSAGPAAGVGLSEDVSSGEWPRAGTVLPEGSAGGREMLLSRALSGPVSGVGLAPVRGGVPRRFEGARPATGGRLLGVLGSGVN